MNKVARVLLSYKVKRQYVQISYMMDTSIKHPISGQYIYMVKGCMDIMFDIVDTAFKLKGIGRLLISS